MVFDGFQVRGAESVLIVSGKRGVKITDRIFAEWIAGFIRKFSQADSESLDSPLQIARTP